MEARRSQVVFWAHAFLDNDLTVKITPAIWNMPCTICDRDSLTKPHYDLYIRTYIHKCHTINMYIHTWNTIHTIHTYIHDIHDTYIHTYIHTQWYIHDHWKEELFHPRDRQRLDSTRLGLGLSLAKRFELGSAWLEPCQTGSNRLSSLWQIKS